MQVIEWIFYPNQIIEGFFLSILLSTISLLALWKVYKEKYTFKKREKTTTWILSVLLMLAGTVIIDSQIPLITWSFLAFHFSVDRKYMELPDGVNLLIGISAIYTMTINYEEVGFIQGGITTGVILFLIFLALGLLGSMGGGDIKMMGFIGLLFTVWDIPALIFYGFLIGAIQGVFLMVIKKEKKDSVFPFGPALVFGVFTYVFITGGGWVV